MGGERGRARRRVIGCSRLTVADVATVRTVVRVLAGSREFIEVPPDRGRRRPAF